MARIAGVEIKKKKRVEIGLTYIYGIGRTINLTNLTLSLFVFRILTDYSDATLSFDDLAFLANWFN